ncbi:MAG: alpha/beta hydrolase [Bacillus mycoides]
MYRLYLPKSISSLGGITINRSIEIFGQTVEVYIRGNSKQTVVIQTGMSCSFYDWLPIIEELSQHFTVVSCHRPGYGKSELGNTPRTARQVTKELHMLLNKLHIHKPIILIGHSYGGLCAQHFAMLHEDRLQALLLVDSTSMNLQRLDELHLPVSDQTDSDDMWQELIREQLNLSINSQYILAEYASHGIENDRPDAIIEAIHLL